jgi:nucleotide-binding universal stress UspA family protein
MKTTARRIVCATDFSPNARSAADVALAIALPLGATLVLVHVTDQAHALEESTTDALVPPEAQPAVSKPRSKSWMTAIRRMGSAPARDEPNVVTWQWDTV